MFACSPLFFTEDRMGNITKDEKLTYLFKGILTLETVEDCYDFFADLCTPAELQEMSRRLIAASMLMQNHIYSEIAECTGLSTATISRVNKCLKFGNEGYPTALERVGYWKKPYNR